jgi:hypothetical protein
MRKDVERMWKACGKDVERMWKGCGKDVERCEMPQF